MKKLKPYVIGYILALALTFSAYFVVFLHVNSRHEFISHPILLTTILLLAMVQLAVQLIFFLRIGQEPPAKWNTTVFLFTFFGILIIVVASIWITYHLNYNMTPTQIMQYTQNQSGF